MNVLVNVAESHGDTIKALLSSFRPFLSAMGVFSSFNMNCWLKCLRREQKLFVCCEMVRHPEPCRIHVSLVVPGSTRRDLQTLFNAPRGIFTHGVWAVQVRPETWWFPVPTQNDQTLDYFSFHSIVLHVLIFCTRPTGARRTG